MREDINDILTVHDSFAVHAPNAVHLNKIIRRELGLMYLRQQVGDQEEEGGGCDSAELRSQLGCVALGEDGQCAQRHGWDGQVETDTATPWIPSGASGWEFGCNQDPKQKAEDDYDARVRSGAVAERKNLTFVFVTPRNWPGKDAWAKEKSAKKRWKDVKAFDASDLEQWLEQSVPAQSWLAEKIGNRPDDILSLDECWDRWSKVTKPELSKALFAGSLEAHNNGLANWLKNPPGQALSGNLGLGRRVPGLLGMCLGCRRRFWRQRHRAAIGAGIAPRHEVVVELHRSAGIAGGRIRPQPVFIKRSTP